MYYSKGLPNKEELIVKCKYCQQEYDLYVARDVSRKKKTRIVRCPKCEKRIGLVN